LGLLCASLLLTAIVVEKTYTPKNNLRQTASILEANLHEKEAYVDKIINNKTDWTAIKRLDSNENEDLKLIENFTTAKRIWFITYNHNKIDFWSGVKVIPAHPEFLKNGRSFVRQENGYYECIKKTDGAFSAIFFIPVKAQYPFQNQYLQNRFDKDLLKDNNVDLADFTDKEVYNIHSVDGNYLFSVKLNGNKVNHQFYDYEISIWILTFICACVLINNIANYIVDKKSLLWGILFLAGFIVTLRFVNLCFHWPALRTFGIFNPDYFQAGKIFPSLGDFCINILMIFWLCAFLYHYRFKFARPITHKSLGYVVIISSVVCLLLISGLFLNSFHQLVIRSTISFDVSNVLNLSTYSLLGILMLGFSFLIFLILTELLLIICNKVGLPVLNKLVILGLGVTIATVGTFIWGEGSSFYALIALLILIRGYAVWYENGQITAISLISLVFICALISALNLNRFESAKEHIHRKLLVERLEAGGDANAEYLLPKIEKAILTDSVLITNITHPNSNIDFLKTYFQKNYLEGYLSKYDFNIYEFDKNGQPLTSGEKYVLDVFKEMVLYGSLTKVSHYFYRENKSFGIQEYFAILPVYTNHELQGTYVLELNTKPLQYAGTFPEILIEGHFNNQDSFKGYSYAFYDAGKLLSQKGDYTYNLVNTDFKPKLKQYVFITRPSPEAQWWQDFTVNSHLIYQPNSRDFIVITKQEHPYIQNITSLTFFFVTLLSFNVIILTLAWLWKRLTIIYVDHNSIRWNFRLNLEGILYRTRIQFSMVFAVVITLVFVGAVTYISISHQYQEQQDNQIKEKIGQIAEAFQNNADININAITQQDQLWFNEFAKSNSADLTLFNKNGVPILTTVPRIYDEGLLARRMNGKAFVLLNKFNKSEFVNAEIIGTLNYKAAYAPIRNPKKNVTVAYLQLPYFSNQADYNEYIGSLLNAMINIYALIFLAIGLFAIIVARQITNPLSIIQYNLSKTIYGQKIEPIKWERNDEIGALVKEYNHMIAQLEESARRLAQSERENAWREMAKQVAHEIKNPLTPLKLGLQLLEKSWKDKDPKFDQKFERFSKSFVEQIESLSQIASEFSAFAKMPETRIERLNVFDTINQATTIFTQTNNLTIYYQPPEQPFYINADRDQLLRCFNNLLKNAIEAMPVDKPGVIQIDYTISARNILITIKDNGKGIPENLRERIFEPNFTTKSSGTGLGLAFVKNSIENAAGKVWYETAINEGTTFYLSLPMA
jgi:nitrogen fixation/metabolism regulation signal transduction histidine kinase